MADFLSLEMVSERDWADAKVSSDPSQRLDRRFNTANLQLAVDSLKHFWVLAFTLCTSISEWTPDFEYCSANH
jgi:hypothetical protein